jgi:hypothetical protein
LPNSQASAAATQQSTLSHPQTHPLHKTLTSLSVSKQGSIEQVGSVIRVAEKKKKGKKKKVSVFMRLQSMTLLEMVLDMAVLFVCLFVWILFVGL